MWPLILDYNSGFYRLIVCILMLYAYLATVSLVSFVFSFYILVGPLTAKVRAD